MSWYRKNPLFALGMMVLALLALGELALIYERFAASRAAAKRVVQRQTDLQTVAQLTPPPKRDVAAAIETDLAKAQAALESMQGELKGRGPYAEKMRSEKTPAARTDAFFDLAAFVERTRELARKTNVMIAPEAARFGFAVYANEGPVPEHFEPVFRQRQIAEFLVKSLIAAKPRSLLSVKRERTMSKADREAQAQAAANGEPPPEIESGEDGPDYFKVDPRMTARRPGYLDTIGFRFVFTSETAALRTFLNSLAVFELPILVREVEVDTATTEETAAVATEDASSADSSAASTAAPSVVLSLDGTEQPVVAENRPAALKQPVSRAARPTSTPIVSNQPLKFTVTVEFVELVAPPQEAAEPTPAAPPAS